MQDSDKHISLHCTGLDNHIGACKYFTLMKKTHYLSNYIMLNWVIITKILMCTVLLIFNIPVDSWVIGNTVVHYDL